MDLSFADKVDGASHAIQTLREGKNNKMVDTFNRALLGDLMGREPANRSSSSGLLNHCPSTSVFLNLFIQIF